MKASSLFTMVASLLLLSAIPARAQNRPPAGIEVGLSGAKIAPAAKGSTDGMGSGLLVGVYGGVQLLRPVGLQVEAVYAQKHSKITTGSRVDEVSIDYFEIPILANMALFKGLKILEGVSLGFPIKAEVKPSSGSTRDIKAQTTSPDIGMVIGVVFPAGRMGIEGRYERGFKKIDNRAGAGTQRNRSYSFVFRIPLNK